MFFLLILGFFTLEEPYPQKLFRKSFYFDLSCAYVKIAVLAEKSTFMIKILVRAREYRKKTNFSKKKGIQPVELLELKLTIRLSK